MANVTVEKGSTIVITGLDADWESGTDSELEYLFLRSIQFIPSAADDRMIIRDGGIDDCVIFDSGKATGAGVPVYEKMEDKSLKSLVIDISDCTLDTAASAKLIIKYR